MNSARENKIHISPYWLFPLIFTGIAVFSIIVTYRIVASALAAGQDPTLRIYWCTAIIIVITFLCSFFLLRMILWPVTTFVQKAEALPVLTDQQHPDQRGSSRTEDAIERISNVFNQVVEILGKVEARELFPEIIGQSRAMRMIFTEIMKVAPTDSTILLSGETGTGKEMIATSIYRHSQRKGQPFVKLNCVAIPDGLLESELFGHEKGAFTGATHQKKGKFELADKGTFFLDEIGDMPLSTQAKILRVLQEREFERVGGIKPIKVDVRIIAATNKNLMDMVRDGSFREDLYHRLNVFSVHLPPLRERREDIPLLSECFLEKTHNRVRLSSSAIQLLIGYSWPGNVRELQNALERAAVLTKGDEIEPEHLPEQMRNEGGWEGFRQRVGNAALDERLEGIEKGFIIDALKQTGGIQTRAARYLGISQRSLWHRVKKYDIDVTVFKDNA